MNRLRTRIWHVLGLLLLVVICVEVGSSALLWLITTRSPSDLRQRLMQFVARDIEELEAKEPTDEYLGNKVLHPFIGFVGNPDYPGPYSKELNEFGFHGEPAPALGDTNQIVIAITGGSVAMDFYFYVRTHDEFSSALRRHPEFADTDIRFVSLALDGMKQPQQLVALNYFLALGKKIDYVINLDGFNEIVLPYFDNVPHGVYPFYPRAWHWYAAKAVKPSQALLFGRIADSRALGHLWQRRLAATPLRYSSFCLSLWYLFDEHRRASERVWEEQLMAGRTQPEAQERGPSYSPVSMEDSLRDSALVWKQSSLQMSRLCFASGIGYLHALQPNQYLDGSKPLSEEEQRVAIGPPDYGYRRAAELGYPILREVGYELVAEGVPFEDLTDVFEELVETVYTDPCCHVNDLGNRHVADRISDRLLQLAANTGRAGNE